MSDEIEDVDDLRGMLPEEIVAVVARERARADALAEALSEVVATADNSHSTQQHAHIERYRALLATWGREERG